MYPFAWIKHQSVHSFFSVVQEFCSTNKPISIHYLWKSDWTIMSLINLMLVMINLPMFLKSSTIFLLHLELKPKNGLKLKTGFDFRRSVSVQLTFWLQLYFWYFPDFVEPNDQQPDEEDRRGEIRDQTWPGDQREAGTGTAERLLRSAEGTMQIRSKGRAMCLRLMILDSGCYCIKAIHVV